MPRRLADLGLLSKVEELQLLSKAEKAGLLSYAENAQLLSFAEKSGAIQTIADPNTPGALTSTGFLLLAGAAAVGIHAQSEPLVEVGSVIVALTDVAATVAGSVLGKIQRL